MFNDKNVAFFINSIRCFGNRLQLSETTRQRCLYINYQSENFESSYETEKNGIRIRVGGLGV